MNKNTYFLIALAALFCISISTMNVSTNELPEPTVEPTIEPIKPIDTEPQITQTPNVYTAPIETDGDVSAILDNHDFDSWTYEEQVLLNEMMMLTSAGLSIDMGKSYTDRVLETYIDLLENAGY